VSRGGGERETVVSYFRAIPRREGGEGGIGVACLKKKGSINQPRGVERGPGRWKKMKSTESELPWLPLVGPGEGEEGGSGAVGGEVLVKERGGEVTIKKHKFGEKVHNSDDCGSIVLRDCQGGGGS